MSFVYDGRTKPRPPITGVPFARAVLSLDCKNEDMRS